MHPHDRPNDEGDKDGEGGGANGRALPSTGLGNRALSTRSEKRCGDPKVRELRDDCRRKLVQRTAPNSRWKLCHEILRTAPRVPIQKQLNGRIVLGPSHPREKEVIAGFDAITDGIKDLAISFENRRVYSARS